MSRVEYQHYIGRGPEAEALIKDAQDRYVAFLNAIRAFEQELGVSGTWLKESFAGTRCGGPTYDHQLTKEEETQLGLKYVGFVEGGLRAYSPRLNTKPGKLMQQKLDEANKLAIDRVRHIVKASGMHHEVFVNMTLARTTCGFADGVIFMRVPTGNKDPQNGGMPTPPPWLVPVKESEFLAAQGK